MRRHGGYLVLMIVAAALCARAQTDNSFSFTQSLASARSVSLGDAAVADIHDAGSVLWNPACLAFLQSLDVTATAGVRMDERLMRSLVTLPVLATESHSVALGAEGALFDQSEWTKSTGKMMGAEISYALRPMTSWAIGMVYNFRSVDLNGRRASSHTAGFGMMYSVFPSLTYGVSFIGLGSGIVVKRDDHGAEILETQANIPRSVTFGAAWRYPATHDRPIVAICLSNQSISGEERLVYRLGVELFPWKFLVLRGGIVSGPVTAVGRAGVGILTRYLEIDYGVSSSVAAERMHYVTLAVPLSLH
ncbi:MAG TPA: hypothetical protein VK470_15525 [Bacteroidota bacterium]|nr:hypothetical protein [Bacteroidota bacterium]